MIDRAPEVVALAVDLHEHLIEMPASIPMSLHRIDAAPSDLGGEMLAEATTPYYDGLMRDVDATFMQRVLDIPKRQREADIQHDRNEDHLM